jgi:hypothetical protein
MKSAALNTEHKIWQVTLLGSEEEIVDEQSYKIKDNTLVHETPRTSKLSSLSYFSYFEKN